MPSRCTESSKEPALKSPRTRIGGFYKQDCISRNQGTRETSNPRAEPGKIREQSIHIHGHKNHSLSSGGSGEGNSSVASADRAQGKSFAGGTQRQREISSIHTPSTPKVPPWVRPAGNGAHQALIKHYTCLSLPSNWK